MANEVGSGGTSFDHLLEPTLLGRGPQRPIYSFHAGFVVAFLGGGLATTVFTALNSRRIGRLERDAWWLALGAAAFVAFVGWAMYLATTGGELPWLGLVAENARELRYANRLLALIFFGLAYRVHRPYYKAAALAGQTPPSPWGAGLACVALATVVHFVIGFVSPFVFAAGAAP